MRVRLPIAATLAAAMAVSSLGINAASAAPAAKLPATHQQSVAEDGQLIQVQTKKKKRVVRRNNNDAAAAAAFMGIAGAMIGLAVQDSQRDRYYRHGYGYGPQHRYNRQHGYYGNRVDYGNRGYYGPRTHSAPVNRHGLLPNNLPVGNDPLNADPNGR